MRGWCALSPERIYGCHPLPIRHEFFHVIGGSQNPRPAAPETTPMRSGVIPTSTGWRPRADAEQRRRQVPSAGEYVLCSDPFNGGSTPLRHRRLGAMFPIVTVERSRPFRPRRAGGREAGGS